MKTLLALVPQLGFVAQIGFAIVTFFSAGAHAGPVLDFGGTFSSDSLSNSGTTASSQNFYNLSAMFSLDSKAQWNVGWAVFGISQSTEVTAGTTKYSSFDMGPAFRWNIDKDGMFSLTLVYGYLAKGKYSLGAISEDWEGSSFLAQFALQAPIREDKFYVGVSVNSYTGTYTEKTVNNVKSTTSATKSSIFPMISFTWRL